jgi:hypothetical protein
MDWTTRGYSQSMNLEDDSDKLSVCITAAQMNKNIPAEHFVTWR